MKDRHVKQNILVLLAAVVAIAFDQWTKYLAVSKLKDQAAYTVLSGVFELQYLENRGAAFGMLQNQQILFVIITVIVLCIALLIYRKLPTNRRYHLLRLCILGITVGAVGNMIDRIRLNYVVDFFYFRLIDFPIFNVADIYVTLSTIGFVLLLLFYYTEDEIDAIFQSLEGRKKRNGRKKDEQN